MEIIPVGRFKPKHFVIPAPDPESHYVKGKIYLCQNTRTKESVLVEYTGEVYNYPWEKIPESFCLTHFDLPNEKLKAALESSFPALKGITEMRFLIMKEI